MLYTVRIICKYLAPPKEVWITVLGRLPKDDNVSRIKQKFWIVKFFVLTPQPQQYFE